MPEAGLSPPLHRGSRLAVLAQTAAREKRHAEAYWLASAALAAEEKQFHPDPPLWQLRRIQAAAAYRLGQLEAAEPALDALLRDRSTPPTRIAEAQYNAALVRDRLRAERPLRFFVNGPVRGWTALVVEHTHHVTVENPEQADFLLIPAEVDPAPMHASVVRNWLQPYVRMAKDTERPFLGFLHSDLTRSLAPLTAFGVLFRTSFRRSYADASEYLLPSYFYYSGVPEDPLPPATGEGPAIGFVGSNNPYHRRLAIAAVRADRSLPQRIIERPSFHFHLDTNTHQQNRDEFLDVMTSCAYQLAPAGVGNYSHRFYECLRLGRIPVVVDTDLPLPLSDVIPWDEHIVIVPDPRRVADALRSWHDRHDAIAAQRKCRALWDEYLAPSAFGGHVERILRHHRRVGVPGLPPQPVP